MSAIEWTLWLASSLHERVPQIKWWLDTYYDSFGQTAAADIDLAPVVADFDKDGILDTFLIG